MRVIVSALLLFLTGQFLQVSAQSSTAEVRLQRLLECQAIEQQDERLTCFDERAEEASSDAPRPARVASAPVVAEPTVAPAPDTQEQSVPFWARITPRRSGRADTPSEFTVTITNVVTSRAGRYYFQSEEGLIWRQVEIERMFVPDDLPAEATVKRATFGTQWLSFNGRRSTRVRRYQAE